MCRLEEIIGILDVIDMRREVSSEEVQLDSPGSINILSTSALFRWDMRERTPRIILYGWEIHTEGLLTKGFPVSIIHALESSTSWNPRIGTTRHLSFQSWEILLLFFCVYNSPMEFEIEVTIYTEKYKQYLSKIGKRDDELSQLFHFKREGHCAYRFFNCIGESQWVRSVEHCFWNSSKNRHVPHTLSEAWDGSTVLLRAPTYF